MYIHMLMCVSYIPGLHCFHFETYIASMPFCNI